MPLRAHPERGVASIEMAWISGDLAAAAEMIHPDAVLVPREGGPSFVGRALFIQFFRRTPDFSFERQESGGHWQWPSPVVRGASATYFR
jgi:hypothetical protein